MSYVLGEDGDIQAGEEQPADVLSGKWLKDGGAEMVLWYRGAKYTRKIPKTGLLTHSEAAVLLRVRRESVWRWVQAGKLRSYTVRNVNVVSIAELRKFGSKNGYLIPDPE